MSIKLLTHTRTQANANNVSAHANHNNDDWTT